MSSCVTRLCSLSCAGGCHNMPPPLQVDLWPFDFMKVVSKSCVTCATSVPILVFLGLCVLDLGPMYRQTDVIAYCLHHIGRRHNNTSCTRAAATICPRPYPLPLGVPAPRAPPSRRNVAVVSHAQYVLTVTAALAWCVKAALSKAAWWPWPFDLESGFRVTCDVGYLCASFGLPRPLCSRLRPDVRDRQMSDKSIA